VAAPLDRWKKLRTRGGRKWKQFIFFFTTQLFTTISCHCQREAFKKRIGLDKRPESEKNSGYASDILGALKTMKGGLVMGKQIQWETSLTAARAKAKKTKKLILMDYYNNL
jgi:hypothetical protein